jgi:hypothetical protein
METKESLLLRHSHPTSQPHPLPLSTSSGGCFVIVCIYFYNMRCGARGPLSLPYLNQTSKYNCNSCFINLLDFCLKLIVVRAFIKAVSPVD